MKRFAIFVAALAITAFSTTAALAKGHSAGHAHHSGSHHAAAHHSASHAHSSHPKAKHPTSNHAKKKAVTTPRVSHATTLSTNRHGYHSGHGRRNYHRNAHYRRHATNRGRAAFIVGPDQVVPVNSGPRVVAPWATVLASGTSGQAPQVSHFQVTSDSNPALFSNGPTVSSTGVLSFTPAPGQSGTATLTLVLRSSAGSSAPQTFRITVKPL